MENFYDIMMAISFFAGVCVWLLVCIYGACCVLADLKYYAYAQLKSIEIHDYEDDEDDETQPKRIRYFSPLQSCRRKK